jgi:tetratricopeptide (TPR) repeat protein
LAQSDLELAEYYYNNGEYEQARLYYERIYKSNQTQKVYEKFLNTLIALGDLEDAEKIVKKKIKSRGNNAEAYVNLGELYKKFGKDEDAEEQFEKAIKELSPGRSNATRLANAFIKLSEHEYALRTYTKGRRISTDGYEFHYELANLQGMMGNRAEMVESFMELLLVSPNYIQTVQNSINRNLNILENEENAVMLKTKLLKRVQQNPNITIYNELLIWFFLQRKDFASALVQAKALDKRQSENGFRLIDIAQLATNNEDLSTAKKAYQALIDKGPITEYYESARMSLLQVSLKELTSKPGYTEESIVELELIYEETLEDLGKKASTATLMKDLAHLKSFYLGKSDESIELLNEAVAIPGLYDRILAVVKLELGDVLLLTGDIWEASLLYSQVELDFKEDVLGHDAKYRNAKISFYTGDFEWAQAQLDVLKASTSKLISNDAIDLSLLITDNFNMDTTATAMLMYARADLLAYQNQVEDAITTVDSIVDLYPGHSLTDEILMLKANIFYERADYDKTIGFLDEVLTFHFMDILADDALYMLAEINHYVLEDLDRAKELYNQLLLDFPGSLYVVEARKRFRELRGDEVE